MFEVYNEYILFDFQCAVRAGMAKNVNYSALDTV